MTTSTATVTTPEEFARRRAERERLRQQQEALKGSILDLLDEVDPPCAPASLAEQKEALR